MRPTVLAALILCFALAASFPRTAAAQEGTAAPAPTATATSAAAPANIATPASTEAPVPVPEPSAKALRYFQSGNVLWWVGTIWGIVVPCLLLFTGFSARMRDWARALGRNWFFTVALYFVFFALVTFLLDLPFSYYSDFVREHAYGLSLQTFGKWLGDSLKGLGVGMILGAAILWVPYLLLRRSPRRWWLYTGLLSLPLLAFLLLVSPIWIDPLFNHFGPMQDKRMEAQILALADRAGISGSQVFEVDKSTDTETVNAYMAGFLGTKRIVLWDTTLKKLTPRETLFVMGHEMGHYVLGHVTQSIFFGAALILFGLWIVHRTAAGLIARHRDRFGFGELGDVASLPLILLLFSLTFLLLGPFALALSRHDERESDRFGLEITHDNHACGTAFVKLQQENLEIPRPGLLYKLWRSSHPPLGERIDLCNDYHPWREGKPGAYSGLIKP